MKSKTLIIDCQILQTPAFDRGMGKYTLSLLRAFMDQNMTSKRYSEVQLLFSSNLDMDRSRMASIKKILLGSNAVVLDLPTNIAVDTDNKYMEAQKLITDYILDLGAKDVDYLITAPFFVGFPSVFPLLDSVGKYSIVYDLIPQKIWHLQQIFPDNIYFKHYALFTEADALLAISRAVRDDLINLGLAPDTVTSIDGGPFSRPLNKKVKLPNSIKSPYILMPSAPIVHKNNDRAVQAFSLFNKKHGDKYRLCITSNFDDETRARLQKLSKKIIFTGNISDEELAVAYKGASAVLFPSLSEGLGMPVLEAAYYDTPVACSRIPVLSELSEGGFYQFDPNDENDIARVLEQAIAREDWATHRDACNATLEKYTWARSAKLLTGALKNPKKTRNLSSAVHIIFPNPRHDSPAAQLGERLYMFNKQKQAVTIQFAKSKKQNRPSYVSHVAESPRPESSIIEISDTVSLKRKSRQIVLRYNQGGHNQRIRLSATKKSLDSALDIQSWSYAIHGGSSLSLEEIMDMINTEDK